MIRVVVGIFSHSGKLLMGRRLQGDGNFGGHWEFPGGKVEAGESDEEALRREFLEEIGAEITALTFLKQLEWQYPKKTVDLRFYLVTLDRNELEKFAQNSHSELKWLTKEEALQGPLLPANVDIIQLL